MGPGDEGLGVGTQQACHFKCALDPTSEAALWLATLQFEQALSPGLMWTWWGNRSKFTHMSSLKGQVGTRSPRGQWQEVYSP